MNIPWDDPRYFEQLVLSLLREDLSEAGQTLLVGNELPRGATFADAMAPDGIGDLPGPTFVEVKTRFSTPALEQLLLRISRQWTEPSSLLVIAAVSPNLGKRLRAKGAAFPHNLQAWDLWDKSRIEGLVRKHPNAATPFVSFEASDLKERARTKRSEFGTEQSIKALASALRADRLVPFLGAGVSISADFPDWEGLLHRLIVDMLADLAPSAAAADHAAFLQYFDMVKPDSPLIMARTLAQFFGDRFPQRIKDALYREPPSPSPLLNELVQLCTPARDRSGPPGVVTFNFDDLFEQALERRGLAYKTIFRERDEPAVSELPVYHVHGFLDSKGQLTNEQRDSLVFSESAYHRQFEDPFCWNNLVQLNLLRSNVCLFIGLSLTDPNLRRLLEITVRRKPTTSHYAIMKDNWHEKADILTPAVSGAPTEIRSLTEQTLRFLGVQVLWVDDYPVIPDVLRRIRMAS